MADDLGKKLWMYTDYRAPPIKIGKSEKHIPGYNFCGPGTQVKERLERGDMGVNDLDNACRLHDVEYMLFHGNKENLRLSDEKLVKAAQKIVNDIEIEEGIVKRMSIGSRIMGWLVENTGIGKIGELIVAGTTLSTSSKGIKLAAKIVASVFQGKGFLEDIGIIDPVSFASSLNSEGKSDKEIIEEGKRLFETYF
jgi:hypothetical protein